MISFDPWLRHRSIGNLQQNWQFIKPAALVCTAIATSDTALLNP